MAKPTGRVPKFRSLKGADPRFRGAMPVVESMGCQPGDFRLTCWCHAFRRTAFNCASYACYRRNMYTSVSAARWQELPADCRVLPHRHRRGAPGVIVTSVAFDLEPKKLDPLIDGLNRALGRSTNSAGSVGTAVLAPSVTSMPHELWQSLGFGPAIKRAALLTPRFVPRRWCGRFLACARRTPSSAAYNGWRPWRCRPCRVGHHDQRLLRTMDALMERAEGGRGAHCRAKRPMLDQQLSVVFYDSPRCASTATRSCR